MSVKTAKRSAKYLNTSSLNRPLMMLGAATALLAAGPAYALDANTLPQDPNVVGGSASFSQSGNTLNVNQSTNRAVIDWRSFDIGSNAQTNFAQPNAASIAVNRVNQSANPTQIQGGLHANGQVWILNPNGVVFGKTAHVDAAGIVASTANIDVNAFMGGSNTLHMSGADHGSVVNEGSISVGESGLAAFVAPSVRNSGTITAKVGKVTLAAGTSYTLDLAGDNLVEIGLGAGNALVDQSGKIVNAGGTVQLSAKAASDVVDSIINVSGVIDASSVVKDGGTIVLAGDNINTSSTAKLAADAGTNGNGGTITSIANRTGNYAGSFSAKGGSASGDGGQIETSGKTISVSKDVSVDTLAANGKTGNWTLDPDDLTIADGTDEGSIHTTASTVNNATIVNLLPHTGVTLAANNSITVNGAIDSSAQSNSSVLALNDQDGGGLTVNLNAPITLGTGQSLTGQGTIVNVGAGSLIQNGVDVALAGGATVNVAAGTYNENVVINKSGLSLLSDDGAASTIINGQGGSADGQDATTLGTVLVKTGANNFTLGDISHGFTILGLNNHSAGIESAAVYFQGANSGSIIRGNVITARGDEGLLTEYSAAVTNLIVDNNTFDGQTFVGPHGLGSADQFTVADVPRQLVVISGGATVTATQNITFTNNQVTGVAGGLNPAGQEQGNTLVTIDAVGATITGNNFAGTTTRYGDALRARGSSTTISGNTFDASNMGYGTNLLDVKDGTQVGTFADVIANNTFNNGSAYLDHAVGGYNLVFRGINSAVGKATAGDTVNVGAGTYAEALDISKSVDIEGAGVGNTIIQPTTLLTTGVSHKYDGNVQAAVYVHDTTGVTLNGLTVDANNLGANAVVFWNNASGTISNALIENPMVYSGAQTGQGIAVDATTGHDVALTVSNTTIQNYNKNGIDALNGDGSVGSGGGNISLTVSGSTFIGRGTAGPGNQAQNGIVLYERGGGTINATIDNSHFSNLQNDTAATPDDWSVAVLQYGSPNGTVSVSNSDFTNTQAYISTAGGSTNEIDATAGNTFDGVAQSTATNDQLFTIQNKIIDGLKDTHNGLVRLKANNVYLTASNGNLGNAVSVASSGNTINVQSGNYTLPSTLNINKSLTLAGAGVGSTNIASNSTGYGINVTADNTTLTGFTYNGPTAGTYGIKVQPDSGDITDRNVNFTISNVAINGGKNTGIDLNAVAGGTIDNVSVSGITNGNGIALTDSQNVTITNTMTSNNAWGGLALYQTNHYYDGQTTGISVDGTNTFNDVIPVYAEDESSGTSDPKSVVGGSGIDFGTISLAGFNYVVNSPNNANDVYSWFQKTQQNAIDFATDGTLSNGNINLPTATVQGYAGSGVTGNNIFTVGIGNNSAAMSIGAAASGAAAGGTVNVLAGTYGSFGTSFGGPANLTIQTSDNAVIDGATRPSNNRIVDLRADGTTFTGFTITSNGGGVGISISGQGVTVSGNAITNALTGVQTTTANAIGNNTISGNTINTQYGISLQNTGNAVSGNTVTASAEGAGLLQSANTFSGNTFNIGAAGNALTYYGSATATGLAASGNTVNIQGGGVQGAVDLAGANGALNLAAGGYTLPSTLNINKSLTLSGAGEGSTNIDGSGIASGYAIDVAANDVNLNGFTLNGSSDLGGIGVQTTAAAGAGATGFQLANVTINNQSGYGIAVVGGSGATIDNLTVDGSAGGDVGVAIEDSANVTITNTKTSGNDIGLGVYQIGDLTDQQLTGLSVDTTNNFSEDAPVYILDAGTGGQELGALSILGFGYAIGNTTDLGNAAVLQTTQQNAINNSVALTTPSDSFVVGWTGSAVTTTYTVGTSTGGTAMSIAAALGHSASGNTINVLTGTYGEAVNVTGLRTLNFGTVTLNSLTLGAGAAGSSLTGTIAAGSVALNGAVTLSGATTLNTSAANGNVTTSAIDGNQALTINAGTGAVSLGNLGATTRLGAVSVTGPATLTGTTYAANSLSLGSATLSGDTTLDTTGALTTGAVDGAHALTVNAASASLGNLGATTRLGAVLVTGPATLTGTTYAASSQAYGGSVTLTGNTTMSSVNGGGITIAGNLFGTTNGGQNLTLNAGTGTGALSANGDISLQNVGTSGTRLNNMTVSGNNFSAATVYLAGNYSATLLGNQVFTSQTLNAGGAVNSNVGGNAIGPINAGGAVNMNVGGNLSGNINGTAITLNTGSITGSTITGTTSITANSNTVSTSVFNAPTIDAHASSVQGTLNGDTIALDATQFANVVITGKTVNVHTPAGVVTGTWDTIGTDGSGILAINGETTLGVSGIGPNQLVVEGFALPAGTTVTPSGALVLPTGVLVGLLSPAGASGQPKVVLVHSVQRLGELLANGYTAIVIDLNNKKKEDKEIVVASN